MSNSKSNLNCKGKTKSFRFENSCGNGVTQTVSLPVGWLMWLTITMTMSAFKCISVWV